MEEKLLQNYEGVAGERPHRNIKWTLKTLVTKILVFFTVKCVIYSRTEFFFIIFLKMYSLVYIMVISIKTFFPNRLVHNLRSNFVTVQFNRTNLQGVRCRTFSTTWQKKAQNWERGAGGDHTSEKMNVVKYKISTLLKILTERFRTASPDKDFRTII